MADRYDHPDSVKSKDIKMRAGKLVSVGKSLVDALTGSKKSGKRKTKPGSMDDDATKRVRSRRRAMEELDEY